MSITPLSAPWFTMALANAVVLGLGGGGLYLSKAEPEFLHMLLQEDAIIEWATVWIFLFAACLFWRTAWLERKSGIRLPWFTAGVGIFCLIFALEEISWGQRLLGYMPPEYFMLANFQQEFNYHNVISTEWRKILLKLIILGYGVAFPLLLTWRPVAEFAQRLFVFPPPLALVPGFGATYALYEVYPFTFTGELVEFMLGMSFFFAALISRHVRGISSWHNDPKALAAGGTAIAAAFALGWLVIMATTPSLEKQQRYVELASKEVRLLARDFAYFYTETRGRVLPVCKIHKRVFTTFRDYKVYALALGRFRQATQGTPDDGRAAYYLDPWNNPYWIRFQCPTNMSDGYIKVYSFGPNKRRDSPDQELAGDDIGKRYVIRRPQNERPASN